VVVVLTLEETEEIQSPTILSEQSEVFPQRIWKDFNELHYRLFLIN